MTSWNEKYLHTSWHTHTPPPPPYFCFIYICKQFYIHMPIVSRRAGVGVDGDRVRDEQLNFKVTTAIELFQMELETNFSIRFIGKFPSALTALIRLVFSGPLSIPFSIFTYTHLFVSHRVCGFYDHRFSTVCYMLLLCVLLLFRYIFGIFSHWFFPHIFRMALRYICWLCYAHWLSIYMRQIRGAVKSKAMDEAMTWKIWEEDGTRRSWI